MGSRPYSKSRTKGGFWFYALINGSAIGNAIYWDGNTFRDSPSVDYDPLIGRIYVGMAKRFDRAKIRSEEHTSELRHVRISYAVFCLKKKKTPLQALPQFFHPLLLLIFNTTAYV